MLIPLAELDAREPHAGGKARGLARLRGRGLAIPDGFVVTPGELPADLATSAAALGDVVVVRSSASVEDLPDAAAPGVFLSLRDVAPVRVVVAAVEAVRASATSPAARAYLGHHGQPGVEMAVIAQRQIAGILGTAYSRAPGTAVGVAPVLVELASGEAALVDLDAGETVRGGLPAIAAGTLVEIARAAREAEDALGRPADIEWVLADGGCLWIVQARPIVDAPAPPNQSEIEAAWAFARAEPRTLWTWDASHNPDPLSPAQAGLVEIVDAARAAPCRQRVVLGYLYSAPVDPPVPTRVIAPADLANAWTDEILPALEGSLSAMRADDLEATLAAYVDFYRVYTFVLTPSVPRTPFAIPPVAVREYDLSPAWDVAVPTYGEATGSARRPVWRRRMSSDRRETPSTSATAMRTFRSHRLVAAGANDRTIDRQSKVVTATTLAEADDLLFARAQTGVRRALCTLARRWSLAEPDIFYLPLDEVRRGRPADPHERAVAARVEPQRQAGAPATPPRPRRPRTRGRTPDGPGAPWPRHRRHRQRHGGALRAIPPR